MSEDKKSDIVQMPGTRALENDLVGEPAPKPGMPAGVSIYGCETEGCDATVFAQGTMLLKISKLNPQNTTGMDQLAPQPGFYCPKCYKFVPMQMK